MKKNIEKAWCMLKKHEITTGTTLLLTLLYFMGVSIWVLERASIQRHQSAALYEAYKNALQGHPKMTEDMFKEGRELVPKDDARLIKKWFNEVAKSL